MYDKANKSRYNVKYVKDNYKQIAIVVKPEKAQQIDAFCEKNNVNRSKFIKFAIDYVIYNGISLPEDIQGK